MIIDILDRCMRSCSLPGNNLGNFQAPTPELNFVDQLTQLIFDIYESNISLMQNQEWTHSDVFWTEIPFAERDAKHENLIAKIDALFGVTNSKDSVGLLIDQISLNYLKINSKIAAWNKSSKDTDQLNDLLSAYFFLKVQAHRVNLSQHINEFDRKSFPMGYESKSDHYYNGLTCTNLISKENSEISHFWDI